jgi:hypothetical protein
MKAFSKKYKTNMWLVVAIVLLLSASSYSETVLQDNGATSEYGLNYIHVKSLNGKLYAYVVLLFNENPHFVNVIQEHSIPFDVMQKEGYHIVEYKNYLKTIKDLGISKIAETMLSIYLSPGRCDDRLLSQMQDQLEKRNIILRFSRDRSTSTERIVLDYCIYGKKRPVTMNHPFFETNEKIFNVIPYIYYDEFSTSNSTFYFDMIYINPDEVHNDYLIAKKVLNNENVDSLFFVGARVSDDIKFCLIKAFENTKSIKPEIWKLFEIHELTHKILNNKYNYFDQIMGEELSLSSTIYSNVYLGLAVLYSYLDYSSTNPHRIAAMNFIKYYASEIGRKEIVENPSLLKSQSYNDLQRYSKTHFNALVKTLK